MARPERSILIIGALILALVAAAIVVTLAFGSDEPADFPVGSPEGALQEYLTAIQDGDTDRAYDLVSQSALRQMSPRSPSTGTGTATDPISRDDFARMAGGSRGQTNSRVRIERVEYAANDQSATITLTIENFSGSGLDFNRSSWTRTLRMAREDGAWKIDEPFFFVAMLTTPSLPREA